ncbi:unnamed protein product [Bursaphelenchus okinawaensis]|uniref:Ribosomal RNA-processing protein 14/surfeit locus protein 6 C-terminal domain-containing protein n=1 Tax=Bursaphelenchus okinawaensis TaxID=465554 RepID=A0A811LHY6_9BILA|nr:unnamed protein product [Bursaphelenchus okinawaensis]CAG9125964.1 unnamed protein product [Bursaphelenchus okinawaensis]
MTDIKSKLESLHNLLVKNADYIPLQRWGFDQNALDIVKSHKHSIVNEKLTFKQKQQLSKKQKQQMARGVGAVPQKVSEVCKLLSNISVAPKKLNAKNNNKTPEVNEENKTESQLDPAIAAILRKKGVKRRNITSISTASEVPAKKNGKENKVVPKKEKKVLTDKERQELKEKRKQSRAIKKNTQKPEKTLAKQEKVENGVKTEESKENVRKQSGDEISFNKLDFVIKDEKKLTKKEKMNKLSGRDYKGLQAKLEKRKEFVKKLKQKDPKKAEAFEKDVKWDTVIGRAEGKKVKDDPQMLMRAQKRKEKLKEKRKGKWDERVKKVQEDQQKRQDKRNTNIAKRRDTKVQKKLERARKKGRLV